MELSVIIVSFNVREYLKQCLISANKASENIDCEIFVVDNNSQDYSVEMVEKDFPGIILIKNETNKGFSAANNQAIKQSKGRFVLLLNPDTIVEPDTFSKCISFMEKNQNTGALGVRMVNGAGKFLPESKRSLPTPKTTFFKAFGFSSIFPESEFFNNYYLPGCSSFETSPAEVISGAFMFIRRAAINKTGLLDEDFFMYGEDIDLSYRLIQAGYINYYFAETQIVHYKGKSTSNRNYTDIRHFYDAMRIYFRKRVGEGKLAGWQYIILPGIYLREAIAVLNRFFKITFRK